MVDSTEPIKPDSGGESGLDFNPEVDSGSEVVSFVWELVKVVAVAVALVIVVKTFLVQPFCVKGASMQETYNNEDYILIDKLGYRFHEPKRFDVIVFRYPYQTAEFFIKRIIGLPGESVEIKNAKTTIYNDEHPDGIVLDEASYILPEQRTSDLARTKIAADQYFVMGDNRPNSFDSRMWGVLDKKFMTGRVFVRVLPQSRFCHLIGTPTSNR